MFSVTLISCYMVVFYIIFTLLHVSSSGIENMGVPYLTKVSDVAIQE